MSLFSVPKALIQHGQPPVPAAAKAATAKAVVEKVKNSA
jgi:hypothetical protein